MSGRFGPARTRRSHASSHATRMLKEKAPSFATFTLLGGRVVSAGGVVSAKGTPSFAPWIRPANVDCSNSCQSAYGLPAASSATTGGSASRTGDDTICPGVHVPPERTAITAPGNADQEANAVPSAASAVATPSPPSLPIACGALHAPAGVRSSANTLSSAVYATTADPSSESETAGSLSVNTVASVRGASSSRLAPTPAGPAQARRMWPPGLTASPTARASAPFLRVQSRPATVRTTVTRVVRPDENTHAVVAR